MAWEHIGLQLDDAVATVTLNRPEALNALHGTMRTDLLEALDEAERRARVLVITGAGKAFCSGGDVRHMARLRKDGDTESFAKLVAQGKRVALRLSHLAIPTLASVNGPAMGAGLSLALACDLRIAAKSARFGASFARIGLHPDWGGTYFLTRIAGPAAARELIFSGRVFGAEEAQALGLVHWIVAEENLEARTRDEALELAAAAPASIRHAKATLARAETASLSEVLDLEEAAQLACFQTEDALEGIRAFEDKRRAQFKGE